MGTLSYASNDNDINSPGGATPLSKAVALWIVPQGFYFANQAAAKTAALVNAKVATGDLIPLNSIDSEEIKDSETNKTETDTGNVIKNWEGKRKRIYSFTCSLDTHKKLRSLNGGEFSAYIVDLNGYVLGTSSDGTKWEPLTLSYLDVGQQAWGAGFATKIEVVFADSEEWDSNGSYFKPSFPPSKITPIYPASIVSQTVVAANVVTVSVAYVSTSMSDSEGVRMTEPIRGLLKENFLAYNIAAPTVPLTPSSITESSTAAGSYELTFAAFTGGPLRVIATTDNLYRSPNVTISA